MQDLVCGSYDGRVYWAPRGADGAFEEPRRLLDEDGDELMAGKYWDDERRIWTGTDLYGDAEAHANAASAVDWDGDGDMDLLLGCGDGRVFLRRNVGSEDGVPRFSIKNEKVKYGRRSVFVKGGGATPLAADWNGDGLFDLLSGSKKGGVLVWLNVGKPGAPDFAAPVQLTPDTGDTLAKDAPGERTQVHVADYDGDGAVDLLVGDYRRAGEELHGYVWLYRRKAAPAPGSNSDGAIER